MLPADMLRGDRQLPALELTGVVEHVPGVVPGPRVTMWTQRGVGCEGQAVRVSVRVRVMIKRVRVKTRIRGGLIRSSS